uniref:Exostosin GT47 domain-containing protein n=1 Tax=Hemiselmis andersenii TaxID=464988 RepID=A0A7S1DZW8_HEMAN
MSDAEDCFRAKWKLPKRGSPRPFEGLDSKMSHENRMYLLELFLWQSVRDHLLRTSNPSEATVFVIGYTPIMLDWSQPCPRVGDVGARQRAIHDALTGSKWFRRRNGTDHVFLWTRYNLKPDKALRSLLDSGPMVAVLERSFFMLQRKWPRAFEAGRVIMMPYVSSGFVDSDVGEGRARHDRSYPHARYFFRGNMKRHGEGLQREVVLPGLAKMLDKADFKHKKVNVGKDKPTVYTDLLNETASELRRASICPCPEGDSPTTLRPFEALASGCLPIFMVEKEIIAYDIPFPSLIDWDSIALFVRSMQDIGACQNGLKETFLVLDSLGGPASSREVAERLERMRVLGKEVFYRHFSFLRNPEGVVSSMLFEARELLRRGFVHNKYQPQLRHKVANEPAQRDRDKQMQHLKGVDVHSGDM